MQCSHDLLKEVGFWAVLLAFQLSVLPLTRHCTFRNVFPVPMTVSNCSWRALRKRMIWDFVSHQLLSI